MEIRLRLLTEDGHRSPDESLGNRARALRSVAAFGRAAASRLQISALLVAARTRAAGDLCWFPCRTPFRGSDPTSPRPCQNI